MDAVEQAGLTGAVRAGNDQYLAFFQLDIDVNKGLQAAPKARHRSYTRSLAILNHIVKAKNYTRIPNPFWS